MRTVFNILCRAGEIKSNKNSINLVLIILRSDVDYLETWRAMEKLVDLGLVKSIGLSNFNSEQVDRVVNESRIKPVSNQIECSPILNQKELTAFCKERSVAIVAYCPLAAQQVLRERDDVKQIAAKYNKTTTQIGLRYLVSCAKNAHQRTTQISP